MITNLLTLAGGALVLGLLHGLIPNHWMPFVLLGRSRGWTAGRMMLVTLFGGIAHLASTVLIGVIIGTVGVALSTWAGTQLWFRWGAPIVLIAAGVWIWARGHRHIHGGPDHDQEAHEHAGDHDAREHGIGREADGCEHDPAHAHFSSSDFVTVGALLLMMFLSPCVELDSYYVVAVQWGWAGIAIVSVIYLIVTTGVMVALVGLSAKGLARVRLPFLERYEAILSGGLLILLGLAWLAFPFEHHHEAPNSHDERHSHVWIMPAAAMGDSEHDVGRVAQVGRIGPVRRA